MIEPHADWGGAIAELRSRLGMTLNQLAKELGAPSSHLRAIERGQLLPDVALEARLRQRANRLALPS